MRRISAALSLACLTAFIGCTASLNTPSSQTTTLTTGTLHAQGVVHGGNQPVTGSTIKLWQVGISGDGSASTSLLTNPVTSGPNGSFSISADYVCPSSGTPANNLVYITATGGNPGLAGGTNNLALVMLAALGPCSSLSSATFVTINEVTTVGSLAALYPYAAAYNAIGAGSGDASAFVTAFTQAAEYTNTTTGTAPGSTLPGGYYASSTEINTLANILASCVNSAGGAAGDSNACGNLLTLATPVSGPAPTDTVAAIIDILNNPTRNAAGLFGLAAAIAPFQPSLGSAPTSWALSILPIAATPTFSVAGGSYSSAQFVTLSDTSSGAVIHYTTDGSTPTAASPTYSGTITVSSASETVQAIATGGGFATSPVASATYTITGSTATFTVGGQVFSTTSCSGSAIPPITITLRSGSIVVQTTTTSSGTYTFTGVPNGTYTVIPTISGPSAAFYPAARTPVINGSNNTNLFFNATLGYTVSGTVNYSGAHTGQTYLVLNSNNCPGASFGTSITTKGAYTIHGVPPGPYTLRSYMDYIGKGVANASDPNGSASATLVASNLTGADVTMTDPATVTLSAAPTLTGVAAIDSGAVAQYQPIVDETNLELPISYTLQWSTSSNFSSITDSQTFTARGTDTDVWFLNSGRNATLTNGSVYYFRAYATSGGTPTSAYSSVFGPVTIGAPTGGNTVTGAISFNGTATGPMYLGFYDQNNSAFYGSYVANPVSAQAYSAQVPTGSNYFFFGFVDQNNNGIFDAGDTSNLGNGNDNVVTAIAGATTNENLALPTANASASVTTHNFRSIVGAVTAQAMNLGYQVDGVVKQPVAVSLASGPNIITPVDLAICGPANTCNHGFQLNLNVANVTPTIGDTYTFNVTYSDATAGTVTAAVTGVVTTFASALAPQTGGSVSTTPTFTWTDPANASNFTYAFSIGAQNGNTIWQIPGNDSNSTGLPSSITSLTWGTDPTDNTNTPSGSLVLNTTYVWSITVQDSNGNGAQTQVVYNP